jgi:hypothetical protein
MKMQMNTDECKSPGKSLETGRLPDLCASAFSSVENISWREFLESVAVAMHNVGSSSTGR